MSGYTLGQPVTITGTVEKRQDYPRTFYTEGGLPFRFTHTGHKTYSEGVIVGSRTVQDGDAWSDDCGRNFMQTPGTARRVWLVAYDPRRNTQGGDR